MPVATSPRKIAEALDELWSPRVIAELEDSYVKVAKVHGTLGWHTHQDEDKLFYILSGELLIEMQQDSVLLKQGELFVVPKGVQHNPVATQECLILLIERKSTLHTGDTVTDRTRSLEQQLRSI